MRALLLLTVIAVIAIGLPPESHGADAQITTATDTAQTAPSVFSPNTEARPGGRMPSHFYPQYAMEHRMGGSVLLCCKASADRSLQCRVAIENPVGHDFGLTAKGVVEARRLTEASYADYLARFPDHGEFPQEMRWNLQGEAVAPPLPPVEQRAAICTAP